jgi:GNAT superfamily N-acetyltransferase
MDIEFKEIVNINEAYFNQAILIYEEAFPSNERQSLEIIKNQIQEGKSNLVVGIIEKEVVCMALLWDFFSIEFVLLNYMAVSKNYRNKKIGSQLFQFVSNKINELNKYLIIEVESHLFDDNYLERKQRINFYIENGAFILDEVNYILPSLNETSPTEMILMIYPKYNNNKINSTIVKNIISLLYVNLYNKKINDKALTKIIHQIPNLINLKNNKLL